MWGMIRAGRRLAHLNLAMLDIHQGGSVQGSERGRTEAACVRLQQGRRRAPQPSMKLLECARAEELLNCTRAVQQLLFPQSSRAPQAPAHSPSPTPSGCPCGAPRMPLQRSAHLEVTAKALPEGLVVLTPLLGRQVIHHLKAGGERGAGRMPLAGWSRGVQASGPPPPREARVRGSNSTSFEALDLAPSPNPSKRPSSCTPLYPPPRAAAPWGPSPAADELLADDARDAALLQDLAAHVQGQVGRVNHTWRGVGRSGAGVGLQIVHGVPRP